MHEYLSAVRELAPDLLGDGRVGREDHVLHLQGPEKLGLVFSLTNTLPIVNKYTKFWGMAFELFLPLIEDSQWADDKRSLDWYDLARREGILNRTVMVKVDVKLALVEQDQGYDLDCFACQSQ